jgi:hypothetical protein
MILRDLFFFTSLISLPSLIDLKIVAEEPIARAG